MTDPAAIWAEDPTEVPVSLTLVVEGVGVMAELGAWLASGPYRARGHVVRLPVQTGLPQGGFEVSLYEDARRRHPGRYSGHGPTLEAAIRMALDKARQGA